MRRQPPQLRRTLRLAAHQLFALDRIPPHAVGSTSVDLLRRNRGARYTGVANAVIRRLAEVRLEERAGDGPLGRLPEDQWPRNLAVRYSLPAAFIADCESVKPADVDWSTCNHVPPLCTRSIRPQVAEQPGVLRHDGVWTWWSDPVAALQGPVAQGEAVVQDRSQGALIELAEIRPGMRVLDLCAAPGGKARYVHDCGARVFAADLAIDKFARLRENLPGVPLPMQDGTRAALAPAFDVVLVDAPCTNSGVFARRPEARWRYTAETRDALVAQQRVLLASAARLVRPGGQLWYGTCSLCPAENTGVVTSLPGWEPVRERLCWPDAWQAGGYAAVLQRC